VGKTIWAKNQRRTTDFLIEMMYMKRQWRSIVKNYWEKRNTHTHTHTHTQPTCHCGILCPVKISFKNQGDAGCRWLTPVICLGVEIGGSQEV
jgi:hypothetical protein